MLIEKEIISVRNMLELRLKIPNYQRPYKWREKSIRNLVNDIKNSMEKDKNQYRIGTIILHKCDEKSEYNIVDGQQRLISLSILFYVLGKRDLCLLEEKFSKTSQENMRKNHKLLQMQLKKIDKQKYMNYILEKCEFVKIVTDNEQEAFQFFDSQNSRGKPLKPHDLLKAYHLREMKEDEDTTKKIITEWENITNSEKLLADLFKYHLYPIKQWIKLKDGLGKTSKKENLNFDNNKIDLFKGIKADCEYNFAKYHRRNQENDEIECENIFQLNQEIIAGKPFFDFVLHYHKLLEEIREFIEESRKNEKKKMQKVPNENLVKKIYESALLFHIDKFGEEQKEYAKGYFFKWAYLLRTNNHSVYESSLNKYAKETEMFQKISEAIKSEEIFSINLKKPEKPKNLKYQDLYQYLISNKEEDL